MGGSLFKKVFKVAAPIAGAYFGGPLGATLASGATSKLSGGSWGDALKSGVLSGLTAYAMPQITGSLSKSFPETMGSLGFKTASSGLGQASTAAPDITGGLTYAGGNAASSGTTSFLPEGFSLGGAAARAGSGVSGEFAQGLAGGSGAGGGGLTSLFSDALAKGAADTTGSTMFSNIPVVGSLLDKGASWAMENPLAAAMAAGTLYSGYSQQKAAEDQYAAQNRKSEQVRVNALNDWKDTLNTPPLARNPTDMSGVDWSTYGYGPERTFYDNNALNYGNKDDEEETQQMASGGLVGLRKKYASGGVVEGYKDTDKRRIAAHNAAIRLKGGPLDDDEYATMMTLLNSPKGWSIEDIAQMTPQKGSPERVKEVYGYANGGLVGLREKASQLRKPMKSGAVKSKTGGMADKVKVDLSGGEFVFPADVVSHLGDGNTDAGAKLLQDVIAHVRNTKTKSTKQPKALEA